MERKTKEQKRKERRLFWSFLDGSKRYFFAGMTALLGMTLCDMLIPQVARTTIDSCIGDEPLNLPGPAVRLIESVGGTAWLKEHLGVVFVTVVVLAALGAGCRYLSTLENTKGGETMIKTMRDRLYRHIAGLPLSWHQDHPAGDIIQRCTSDVNMIKEFCARQLYSLVRIVLMIVMGLAFMASMQPMLTLCALAFIPIIVGYSLIFHIKIRNQFQKCDENEGILSTIAQENLTGVRVVRAFGQEAREDAKFKKQNNVYTSLWMKLCYILAWFWGVGDLVSGLQVMSIVALGAVFCIRGHMTVGSYIAFISYNNMLVQPVRQLGRMISEMSKSGVSLGRISEILSGEPETSYFGEKQEADFDQDIVFDHVSFSFGEKEVLHDVCLEAKGGTTIGILGNTGSGKSTLMELLCRLYELPEDGGRITVGGVDLRNIPLADLRKKVGIVLQDPYLFSRTIGENIAITGKSDQDTIDAAIATAALTDTLKEFPEGLDTMVGERGMTLSGGQKQRVAIARMLTEGKPIMVFDDSLSAVDAGTDRQIQDALQSKLGGATVFLISHRISTICHADRIYVMENGRVTERGTHEELKKAGGLYQKICEIQEVAV